MVHEWMLLLQLKKWLTSLCCCFFGRRQWYTGMVAQIMQSAAMMPPAPRPFGEPCDGNRIADCWVGSTPAATDIQYGD
jgi:hypothetical protein